MEHYQACERCGQPGTPRYGDAITLCDDCELEARVPEVRELRQQLRGAVEAERARIVALIRHEAENFDDAGGVLSRLADHIASGGR